MLEALREHLWVMLLCVAFFVFGIVTSLLIKPDEKGIYLVINWDGKEMFALGKNTLTVSSLDLKSLSETDSKTLAGELEELPPDHALSEYLIELSSRDKGPFKPVDLKKIQVKFVDTEPVSGQLAMACSESKIFGRRAYLYGITSPKRPEVAVNGKHMKDFYVQLKQEDLSECTKQNGGVTVWINRKTAKEWFGLNDDDLPYVYARARI